MSRLQELLDEGIIDEVYSQLKSGKEAEVWLVSHQGEAVAAKLYKGREFRSFKNNAGYKEGRQVSNSRTQRAMDRGSAFGRSSAEEAWKSAEADALEALFKAGVRVPRPVLFYEGVLLMEVIGDHEGRVAPRLVEAALTVEQGLPLYLQLRGEIIKMLAADLIHGDLSEFNVLLGVNGPVIIDFPQVITAAKNSQSEAYFRRDLGNLLRFFSRVDPRVARHTTDADEIWRAYVRRELTAGFIPTGRVPREPARRPEGERRGKGDRGRPGAENPGRPARGPAQQNKGKRPEQSTQPGRQATQQPGPSPNQRRQDSQRGPPRWTASRPTRSRRRALGVQGPR